MRVLEYVWAPVVVVGNAIGAVAVFQAFRHKDELASWTAVALVLSLALSCAPFYIGRL